MKEELEQIHRPINLSSVCIDSSCNGLILCHDGSVSRQAFTIWNPATKEFKRIERPKKKILGPIRCVGFGCSAVANDYKIVIFLKEVQRVFSLSTGTWRDTKVESLDYIHFSFNFGRAVYADEAMFWKHTRNLISFDIDKEVFSKIELPAGINHTYDIQLVVYKDSIAMLHCTSNASVVVDVWVMDKKSATGKCSTWVKLFSAGPFTGSTLEFYPLNFFREELLLYKIKGGRGSVLSLCSPNSNKLKDLPYIALGYMHPRLFLHVESLVPLDG